MKVLIIGGYGTFGFGIAERLSNEAGLELILAGRNFEKAKAACAKLSGAAKFTPLKADRKNLELSFKPDLIIDASGPFQTYRVDTVVDYCIEHAIHYADLSDDGYGTAFAKAKYGTSEHNSSESLFMVFGLSTCPVLSAIGLREIENEIGPATDVIIGIAPSPKVDLGRNVIAAVANYAGRPKVRILQDGNSKDVAGLTDTRLESICVPGGVSLPRLPFAVVDTPDAHVLQQAFPSLKNIWAGVGTRPSWLHRCLIALSRAAAKGIFLRLSRLTGLFYHAGRFFKYGSHRGGMFVRASNDTGEASWHLVAEGDHGPRIPTLPAVALVRKMMRGEKIDPGSYSGDELIDLKDLAPEFEQLDVTYGLQFDGADLPVYEKIMGVTYAQFAPAIQDLHRTGKGRQFSGRCTVTRGRNPLSNIVARIIGFPKSGQDVPVSVTITPDPSGETWIREFGSSQFQSHHRLPTGKWSRHVKESFGPISIYMAILNEGDRLRIETQGWSIFGIPLPKFLRPSGDVYEAEDTQGRFVFHVDLKAPIFGRLCKYEGWLVPDTIDS